MSDNIPLFPVSSITIGPIEQYQAVTVKFDFLTSPMQPLTEANPGRHYVLTIDQAQHVVDKMQSAIDRLRKSAETAPPGSLQ